MLNVLLTSHIQKINKKHDLSDSDAFIVYCLSKILPIEEQTRLQESYSHNNFFKSSDILSMISQEITHKNE